MQSITLYTFFGAHQRQSEDRPILQRQQCSLGTRVSVSMRFMRDRWGRSIKWKLCRQKWWFSLLSVSRTFIHKQDQHYFSNGPEFKITAGVSRVCLSPLPRLQILARFWWNFARFFGMRKVRSSSLRVKLCFSYSSQFSPPYCISVGMSENHSNTLVNS